MSNLEPPRFEDGRARLIAGLSERYSAATMIQIPAQWRQFAPWIGRVPGQNGFTSYGVLSNSDSDGDTDYLCGVEVSDVAGLPAELTHLRLPEQRYAVFTHRTHISAIGETWSAIFEWLRELGHRAAKTPQFELYDDRFDPATGNGLCEIWIPVER